MILYHTGQIEIPRPDIHYGRRNADFGQGFYLTPDRDFTYRWAWKDALINRYELDMQGLRVHVFQRTEAWFEYIFNNRKARDGLDVDVVIGPIANDTIFDTFGLITSGFLKAEQALKLLRIGPEYTQVALKTQRSADQLKWIGSEKTADLDAHKASLKAEQEEYSRQFASVLEALMEKGI